MTRSPADTPQTDGPGASHLGGSRLGVAVVLLAGGVGVASIMLHVSGANGPWYWQWLWRHQNPLYVWAAIAVAAVPFAAAQAVWSRSSGRRRGVAAALALLMLSTMLLRVGSAMVSADPPGVRVVSRAVRSTIAGSYYPDAAAVEAMADRGDLAPVRLDRSGWLAAYPRLSAGFHLHTQTKPPGPVGYYLLVRRAFGAPRGTAVEDSPAALAGGLGLGLLATLAVPLTYALARRATAAVDRDGGLPDRSRAASFAAASFLAACPGFALFFPAFDPIYAAASAAMVLAWLACVTGPGGWRGATRSTGFGAALAGVTFVTYNVLPIGLFLLGLGWLASREAGRSAGERVALLARRAAGMVAGFVAANGLLWAAFGYDAVATFRAATANQVRLFGEGWFERPYPATALFDLTDFAFGAGWVGAVVAALWAVRLLSGHDPAGWRRGAWPSAAAFAGLLVGQLLVTAASRLLPGETARVWAFYLPLLMVPVGLELSRWRPADRWLAYAAVWAVTGAVVQNMWLVFP